MKDSYVKKRLIPFVVAAPLVLVGCGSDIDAVIERCQDHVSGFAKYPGTADWVEIRTAEEMNGKIYINGGADFNNDAGNPVRNNYSCTLDLETGEWERRPSLEPMNPTGSRWGNERWGGAASPMLEKYGDSMSLER